jgi:DNA polymerase-1
MTRWDAWKNYEEEHASQKSQIERLIQYLSTLPINVIQIDNIEADDTIAYIANNLLEKEVTIMSADQDFLQLVNERITVWSPIKKKFYTPDLVMKDYGVPAHNFLMYKVLMGDKSDNIEGVKGLGPKKLPKIVPDIITEKILDLDSIVQEALEGEEPMHDRIVASEHQLEINEKIMDLKNPPISGELKRQIREMISRPIDLLSRNDFTMMYYNDCMGNALQIPDAWLTQHFVKLNSYAESTHE